MPWTLTDVDRFKKGLTQAQKYKWVTIANNVLANCKAKGGNEEECAAQAVKVANSRT